MAINGKIPAHMEEALVRYRDHHIRPGNFLQSVISNDLIQAVYTADDVNIRLLPEYVQWLRWNITAEAWGSPEALDNWIAKKGESK